MSANDNMDLSIDEIVADIAAAGAEALGHADLMAQVNDLMTANKEALAAFAIRIFQEAVQLADELAPPEDEEAMNVACRAVAIRLVEAGAFVVMTGKADVGESVSAARFALASYEIASRIPDISVPESER